VEGHVERMIDREAIYRRLERAPASGCSPCKRRKGSRRQKEV
jgi:hypothetical protein